MPDQGSDELGRQLLLALKRGWFRKALKLIKAGANLFSKDASGNRAVDIAKKTGNEAIIRLLTDEKKKAGRIKSKNM